MSVINNVLKDLETRESSFAPIQFPALETRAERRPAWRPLLLILLVVVSAAAAGWYYWRSGMMVDPAQWLRRLTAPVATNESQLAAEIEQPAVAEVQSSIVSQAPAAEIEVAPAPLAATTEAPEVVEPIAPAIEQAAASDRVPAAVEIEASPRNQIIGLHMREADSEMHLEFSLRDKVIAYMTERNENGFSYHLRDIDNQIAAPVLRDNRWLQSLSISNQGDGVDVRFETVAGILVETRQQQGKDEQIWRISFRQPEPAIEAPVVQVRQPSDGAAKTGVDNETPKPVPAAKPTNQRKSVSSAQDEPVKAGSEPTATVAAAEEVPDSPAQQADEVKLNIRTTNPNADQINRLKYALELINTGRQNDAEKLLQELLYSSEDHAARMHLLALYGHQGRHDRLARLAQNSLARYPGDAVFLTEYARSRYQSRGYRVALELLSGIPRLNADQHALAAASHQRLENHERAIEHYRKALAIDAGNAKNWVGLGISQEHTADLEKALQSYRNAMKLGTLNERLLTFVEKRSATLAQVLK